MTRIQNYLMVRLRKLEIKIGCYKEISPEPEEMEFTLMKWLPLSDRPTETRDIEEQS